MPLRCRDLSATHNTHYDVEGKRRKAEVGQDRAGEEPDGKTSGESSEKRSQAKRAYTLIHRSGNNRSPRGCREPKKSVPGNSSLTTG